jgi:hypothetical protein
MKHIYYLLVGLIALSSCQKELQQNNDDYISNIKASLKDSVSSQDYNKLDFTKAILSKSDSAGLYLLRIPFHGKELKNDFVLLQTSKTGQVQRGKIIHLEGARKEYDFHITWNGSVEISSLNRKDILQSAITNGYIEAFHKTRADARLNSMMAPDVLPEIVVVAYISSGVSYSDWVWLQSFFYQSMDYGSGGGGGGSYDGSYYGSLDGSYSGGGGTYSGSTDPIGGVSTEPMMLVDKDTYADKSAIEIKNYIKCFDAVPDAGSTCSIEIFADIPVDADPTKLFDFNSGSPGHTFIQLKKSNGSKSVIQNIGFYPKTGWKVVLTNAPLDGKFVDDSQHEFNASLKMNLSPAVLRSALTEVLYLANFIKYDIDDYNCTDFALDVFNKCRSVKLEIPLYDIPGSYPSYGTSTPQGLYNQLKAMKNSNSPEAANINIGMVKGWVAASSGPCN